MGKIKSDHDVVEQRQSLWSSFISDKALKLERLPGESMDDYRERRKGNAKITKILLRRGGNKKMFNLIPRKAVPDLFGRMTSKKNGKGKYKYIVVNPKSQFYKSMNEKRIQKSLMGHSLKVPAIQADRTCRIPIV